MADNGGGKNKKYGRNAKRPAQVRYRTGNVCAKNKARNIKRAQVAAATPKDMAVPRGTARASKRASWNITA